jgi:hypothetical protein
MSNRENPNMNLPTIKKRKPDPSIKNENSPYKIPKRTNEGPMPSHANSHANPTGNSKNPNFKAPSNPTGYVF